MILNILIQPLPHSLFFDLSFLHLIPIFRLSCQFAILSLLNYFIYISNPSFSPSLPLLPPPPCLVSRSSSSDDANGRARDGIWSSRLSHHMSPASIECLIPRQIPLICLCACFVSSRGIFLSRVFFSFSPLSLARLRFLLFSLCSRSRFPVGTESVVLMSKIYISS